MVALRHPYIFLLWTECLCLPHPHSYVEILTSNSISRWGLCRQLVHKCGALMMGLALLIVMVSHIYVKTNQIFYFKYVQFLVLQLYMKVVKNVESSVIN